LSAAKGLLERILETDPENAVALRHLGDLFLLRKEPEGAMKAYGSLLRACPGSLEALSGLARASADAGLVEETGDLAGRLRRSAPGIDPAVIENFVLAALDAKAKGGNSTRAKILRLFRRGVLRDCLGEHAEAAKAYARVLEEFPGLADAQYNLAQARWRAAGADMGGLERALADAEAYAARAPADPQGAVLAGRIHLDLGQPAKAAIEFAKALRIQADNPDARRGLAQAFAAGKRFAEARREADRFLKEFPRDPRTKEVRREMEGWPR
ncbi:MAG: tetratricopeptide repeat protein, partial [Planctomycetota bacterium]